MNKIKLKQRIKELESVNLLMANINVKANRNLAELKKHHVECMDNMASEVSELRLKSESLLCNKRHQDSQIHLLNNELHTASHDEKANARFMARVMEINASKS